VRTLAVLLATFALAATSCRSAAPHKPLSVTVYLTPFPTGIARLIPEHDRIAVGLTAYGFGPSTAYSVRIYDDACAGRHGRRPVWSGRFTSDRRGAVAATTAAAVVVGGLAAADSLTISEPSGRFVTCSDLSSQKGAPVALSAPGRRAGGFLIAHTLKGTVVFGFELRGLGPGSMHVVRFFDGTCRTAGIEIAPEITGLAADARGEVNVDRRVGGLRFPLTKAVALEVMEAASSRVQLCGEIPAGAGA